MKLYVVSTKYQPLISVNFNVQRYQIRLMLSLPENKIENAENGIIYINDKGEYVLRDLKGDVQRGEFNIEKMDISQFEKKLEDEDLTLIRAVLEAISKAGYTKPFNHRSISTHDLQATFNASKQDTLIACDSLEEATSICVCLLQGHNTTRDFIAPGIALFAAPVVYTVELASANLPAQELLTNVTLAHYGDRTTIPLYHDRSRGKGDESDMADKLSKLSQPIKIRKLTGLKLEDVLEASYIKNDGSDLVKVNMKSQDGIFAHPRSCAPSMPHATSLTPQ